MECKWVLFDFDGTLADSLPLFRDIVNESARKFRFREIKDEDIDELRTLGAAEAIPLLEIPRWKLPWIARFVRKEANKRMAEVRLFEGVGEMLRGLSGKGIKIGILTSNSEEAVRMALGSELVELVDDFECSVSLFGKAKRVRKFLRKEKLDKDEVVLLGDEIRDIHAGRKAGVRVGAVTWGFTVEKALRKEGPEFCFHSVLEILDLAAD
ncbi:MAG: HAD-IA family hydrolase [Verrucomicrobiota bacterium]